MRYVVVPQGIRRVVPPLLNDFISLQKDTALVGAARTLRRPVRGPRLRQLPVQLHALRRGGLLLHRADDPAGPVHRPSAAARDGAREAGCPMSDALLEVTDLRKSYGEKVVLREIGPDRLGARRDLPDRVVRLRQVDPAALPQPAGGHRRRRDRVRGPGDLRPTGRPARGAQPDGDGLPVLQPLPPPDRPRQLHPGAPPRARRTEGARRSSALATSSRSFGLADQADKHPDRMSGGQQQRAALVRALCTQPTLLLLDEITAALDPELVGDVLTIVRDLAEQGTTMILATHEMSFARDVATSVCFLDQGRILEQGPPARDLQQPARGAHPPVPRPRPAWSRRADRSLT